jgi:dihydrolipoamide dehydrogenase
VLGNGPAGVEAAREAARHGSQVTLVGREPVGGRAGWHSLLPSKVMLHFCRERNLKEPASADLLAEMTGRIHTLAERYNGAERGELESLDVEFAVGEGRLVDGRTVRIERGDGRDEEIEADAVVVTTGSVPRFPDNLKPNGQEIIAPRHISHLESLPTSMVVVGGGVTGTEFAYGFNALGVEVAWVVDDNGVLPGFDHELGSALSAELLRQGVTLVQGSAASELIPGEHGVTCRLVNGDTYRAQQAFVGIGRRPDVEGLGLEDAGLEGCDEGIGIDEYGRTDVATVFAAGDVTGGPMTANRAMEQARVAGLGAAGVEVEPLLPDSYVRAAYSHPQIAQVGTPPAAARNGRASLRVASVELQRQLQPLVENDDETPCGFLRLVYDKEDAGRVVGATAFGRCAADLLAPVSLAVREGMTIDRLATRAAGHPTLSEAAFAAAKSKAI